MLLCDMYCCNCGRRSYLLVIRFDKKYQLEDDEYRLLDEIHLGLSCTFCRTCNIFNNFMLFVRIPSQEPTSLLAKPIERNPEELKTQAIDATFLEPPLPSENNQACSL